MNELPVTWRRAGRVYWAFFWRGLVYLLLPLFLLGFFLGIALAGNGMPIEQHQWKLQAVLFPISVVISVWIFKDVLTARLGSFRIVLVPTEDGQAQPSLQADGPASGGSAA